MFLDHFSTDLDVSPVVFSTRPDPITALQTYLSAMPTPTAVRSAINALTRLLLLHTAQSKRASHLVLGSSLVSTSISLINSIAQGSGFNIRAESYEEWLPPVNFECADLDVDAHEKSPSSAKLVKVVRPLKDVGMKECAAWAWWNDLTVVRREIHLSLTGKHTIQSLTNGSL